MSIVGQDRSENKFSNGSMSIARAGQFEIKMTIINTISEAPWTQGALYLYDGLTEKSGIIVKTVLR